MYLGCRFLPIRVRGIFSYPPGKKWITSVSMYPSTVKVGSNTTHISRCVEIIILRYPIEIFGVGCQIVQLMPPPDSSNSASRQGAFGV